MPKYNEPLLARLRHQMNDAFTTSEFKDLAYLEGIHGTEAQKMLSHMIDRGFIKRVKNGHYEKTNRYKGEQ